MSHKDIAAEVFKWMSIAFVMSCYTSEEFAPENGNCVSFCGCSESLMLLFWPKPICMFGCSL